MTELKEPTIEELKLEIETQPEEEDLILPEETIDEQIDNLNLYLRFNANQIPQVVAGAGAGTTPGTPTLTNANDTKGQINITTGTATPTGTIVTVTFARNYSTAPIIVLTPANAATAALTSGDFSIATATIANNTNVASSTGAGTNTDTVVTHGLGATPKKITISASILAKGQVNADGRGHGIATFDASSSNPILIDGWFTTVDPNGTLNAGSFQYLTGANAFLINHGAGDGENIKIQIVSIGATYFTFRINGFLSGTDAGSSTVTNISWIAEGGSSPSKVIATSTTTGFTISSTTTGLTDSTAYSWFYHCLE